VSSPLIRRLRLGDELRVLRRDAHLSSTALGAKAGMDRLTVERIERGDRKPDTNKVLALLEALDVAEGSPQYLSLIRMSRDAARQGWWEHADYKHMGEVQRIYADIESGATEIFVYSSAIMPGLLQTRDYMTTRFEAVTADGDVVDPASLAARLRRQDEVIRDGGPQLTVVVEEQVIRRPLVESAVMAEQIRHLLALLERRPQISLRVLPVDAPFIALRAPTGPFTTHRFGDDGDGFAVLVEVLPNDQLIRDADGVAQYVRLADRLRDVTLSEADSATFLQEHAGRRSGGGR
jgi:transcriptional regulator with XRE-family HTH domain